VGVMSQRTGSRVAVVLPDEVLVIHRLHPSPDTDKMELVLLVYFPLRFPIPVPGATTDACDTVFRGVLCHHEAVNGYYQLKSDTRSPCLGTDHTLSTAGRVV
jgi:hypothetical protein